MGVDEKRTKFCKNRTFMKYIVQFIQQTDIFTVNLNFVS